LGQRGFPKEAGLAHRPRLIGQLSAQSGQPALQANRIKPRAHHLQLTTISPPIVTDVTRSSRRLIGLFVALILSCLPSLLVGRLVLRDHHGGTPPHPITITGIRSHDISITRTARSAECRRVTRQGRLPTENKQAQQHQLHPATARNNVQQRAASHSRAQIFPAVYHLCSAEATLCAAACLL
jgi:hypothetical protein